MTLEDFFTLTEMKDGLSNPSRVEELLSVIKNLNEFGISNGGDAVRQCTTVASTLAATEANECLNLFVQLDGLLFLNKWLQEALSLSGEFSGNVVEDLTNALLASFDRLPIDNKIATASGISVTLKHLLGHECLQIKEKAKTLCDKWNCFSDDNPELEKDKMAQINQSKTLEEAKMENVSPCQGNIGKGASHLESLGMETNNSLLDAANEGNQVVPLTSSNSVTTNAVLEDANLAGASFGFNSNQDNSSAVEESSDRVAPVDICRSECTREGDFDSHCEVPLSVDASNSMNESEVNTVEDKLSKSIQRDISGTTLCIPDGMQVSEACLMDSKNTDPSVLMLIESQARSGVADSHIMECSSSTMDKEVEKGAKGSKYSISTASNLSSSDGPQSSYQRMDALRGGNHMGDLGEAEAKISKVDILTLSGSLRVAETKGTEDKDQKVELGFIEDALEVARQVAIAVEREVVDYREPFSSSPEANSGESAARSSGSEDGKQDNPVPAEADGNSLSAGTKDHSGSDSSSKGTSDITENISSDPQKSDQDSESPKLEISARESVIKSDVSRCSFDLNADICNEEFEGSTIPVPDMQVNVSAPVAIVASSRGAAVSPSIPLHFGGELGWKGSAATSAFRPASPRRTPNSEKACSGSKHKSSFLEFDLNVPSGEDEVFVEPTSVKHIAASSSLPSGDSSMEVSSRKAEMLKLDLNRMGDEDASAYPSSYQKVQHHNGEQSLSSASSSSARQPSSRDFDLNDNPSFLEVGCRRNFEKSSMASDASKLDDPVITIMGSRMSLEKKDFGNPVQQSFLSNGLNMEPPVPRPLLSYAHAQPAPYGYGAVPNGSTVSVPRAFYPAGSIPYMVDTRGATVFPQIIGSGGYNGGPSARPPFFMNFTSAAAPGPTSGYGSFQPGFDLNSGVTLIDGANKDSGNIRQFLRGQNGLVEDQRQVMQPSSSGISLKRKEPEGGWEPYGHKHVTSWQ